MQVNQAYRQTAGEKFITCESDGIIYFAPQNIDEVDIPAEIADSVQDHEVHEDGLIHILLDTEISNDWGGNFPWYGYVGTVDTNGNFWGTRPPRKPTFTF